MCGDGKESGQCNQGKGVSSIRAPELRQLLYSPAWPQALEVFGASASRRLATKLLSFLPSGDLRTRWRAAEALGRVMERLASEDLEVAREVMRRLFWSLNEESGSMGWGVPEALGEIMGRSDPLREEFFPLFVSKVKKDLWGSVHPDLRLGYLWGSYRLALRGKVLSSTGEFTLFARHSLQSGSSMEKGWAAMLLGQLKDPESIPLLKEISKSPETFFVYEEGELVALTVGEAAAASLLSMSDLGGKG